MDRKYPNAPKEWGWQFIFQTSKLAIDPVTDLPHIYNHDVSEQEVEDILTRPLQDIRGREESRIALGQTEEGRYVKVIYVPDPIPESVFVITAYELGAKAKQALRRRRRRKR